MCSNVFQISTSVRHGRVRMAVHAQTWRTVLRVTALTDMREYTAKLVRLLVRLYSLFPCVKAKKLQSSVDALPPSSVDVYIEA